MANSRVLTGKLTVSFMSDIVSVKPKPYSFSRTIIQQ